MCTAISLTVRDNYFGRNLDYEHTFGEKITITPRKYRFSFTNSEVADIHYAMIGMALPYNDYPLYFDATNEAGLSMAGLNFPGNAVYKEEVKGKINIASFEFIPWVLSQFESVDEVINHLKKISISNKSFDEKLPPTPLHWLISDKNKSITAEQTEEGFKIYDNPCGVLTNNPCFDYQITNLSNYMMSTSDEAVNRFSRKIQLDAYSRGMGALGIPGDLSSTSRFVKACFVKLNSLYGETENEIVNSFFHVLYSVFQQKGCVKIGKEYEMTNYSSCCNTDKGIYYYTTYYNTNINAVDMHNENLDTDRIIVYDLCVDNNVKIQNKK